MTRRRQQINNWLESLNIRDYSLSPASADASFRVYFRVQTELQSWVLMDAPPARESCVEFISIAQKLRRVKLSAPEIVYQDLDQGFLLMTDFGNSSYLSVLEANTEGPLYADAMSALLVMQTRISAEDLPAYDEVLLNQEMDLFHDWFLNRQLGLTLSESQSGHWQAIKQLLVSNALEQPRVFVHRDFHSRNLMKLDSHNPGILDFQDAVKGPVTYDLVSLLRDCYIAWPAGRVEQLALDYYDFALANELVDVKPARFMHWFNLMGVQRHLKAIGIFARLNLRDAKPDYLKDIPRTLEYLNLVSAGEMNLVGLHALISELGLGYRVKAFK